MGVHVFPVLIPPPTSLPIPSLWVIPVHQPWALVSGILLSFAESFNFVLGLKDLLTKETAGYIHNKQFQYLIDNLT